MKGICAACSFFSQTCPTRTSVACLDYSTNIYCTCKPGLEASIWRTNDPGNKLLLPTPNLKCPQKREVITSHCHGSKFLDDNKPKCHLKSEFALFHSSSILQLNFISFVKCWRNVLGLNPKGPYLTVQKEKGKFCVVFTYSVNLCWRVKLGRFMSQSCNDGLEMYKKAWCTCKVVALLI